MIRKRLSKIINSSYFPMIIMFIAIWLMLLKIALVEGTDDTVHIAYLSENGIFKWIYNRIVTWQPRIYADFMFALFLNNLPLWRILSAIQVIIMLFCISKMSTENIVNNELLNVNYFICCVFFFVSPYVVTSGMMWYTGSFYYLWQVTTLLISIVPFYYVISKRSIIYKNLSVVFFITTILTCYNEQTLAIIFCFGTLCILYLRFYKVKIPRRLIIQYLLILVNGAIFVGLSQIADRMSYEMHWYNGFDMLSLIDKIVQGVNWTNFHYINSSNLLMLVLSIELFLLLKENDSRIVRFMGVIPFSFFLFRILPFDIIFKNININNSNAQLYTGIINPYKFEEYLNNYFYNTTKIMPNHILNDSIGNFLPSFFGLFIMLFISFLLWFAIDKKEEKFLIVILYLAALASGYVVGFSPTIFASGSRIFFVGNMLIILVTVKLYSEILKNKICYYNWLKYIIFGVALLFWFQLTTQFTRAILWL